MTILDLPNVINGIVNVATIAILIHIIRRPMSRTVRRMMWVSVLFLLCGIAGNILQLVARHAQ